MTNTLAANVPLTNGVASVTTSALSAGGSYPTNFSGSHFIIATYSGDATFPTATATLIQKVHSCATTTTLHSAVSTNNTVTVTATVTPNPVSSRKPTGMVSFWNGDALVAQIPLNTNGVATFSTTNLSAGSHGIVARYASDSIFASSSATLTATPPSLRGLSILGNGAFRFTFSNVVGAPFSVLVASDPLSPLSNWPVLGPATETEPGQFQFSDPNATQHTQRFYRVRSP
jgi:hypothetical protein